jgi:hypothetical protein
MPTNPRSRRQRRPQRPASRPTGAAPVPGVPAAEARPQPLTPAQARRLDRTERIVTHDAPYVIAEVRRIALVTAASLGLLVVLVVIDRLQ